MPDTQEQPQMKDYLSALNNLDLDKWELWSGTVIPSLGTNAKQIQRKVVWPIRFYVASLNEAMRSVIRDLEKLAENYQGRMATYNLYELHSNGFEGVADFIIPGEMYYRHFLGETRQLTDFEKGLKEVKMSFHCYFVTPDL